MRKTIYNKALSLLAFVLGFWAASPLPALAQEADELFWGGMRDSIRIETGLGGAHPVQVIADLIAVALSFLGILAVVLIMLAGFKWMVSGGNEDKVIEAKKMLGQSIVGLIIILASFALANFVLTQLAAATNATGGV